MSWAELGRISFGGMEGDGSGVVRCADRKFPILLVH
jgi:hypothetical protein